MTMQNKRNRHGRQGHNVTGEPLDSIHLGEGERIRLEDVPQEGVSGDQQVGNREYNDARYQPKGEEQAKVARWIIPPVVQWTRSGYIFSTSQCSYELPGSSSPIVANPASKTLSSPDASFDRFDLFVWNDAGDCIVIEGTPAAEPIVPVVSNPLTQIAGPFVLVKTGTTQPDPVNLTTTVVYNENTEWAGIVVGCTGNFDTMVPVFTGFKCLEVSGIAVNDYIEFTATSDFNPLTFDSFGLQLRLKASMLTNQNLGVTFFDASNVAISNERNLTIEKTLLNQWQLCAVNIDSFAFNSNNARKIRIRWTRGTSNHAGFYIDLVQLQGGIVPPVVAGTVVLQGQVQGSGQTGSPINVVLTPQAVSAQPSAGVLQGAEEIVLRDPITNELRKTTLVNAVALANGNTGRRLVSAQILVDSPTAGRINAEWYSASNVLRTLTNSPLTFLGATSIGNLRWDLVELYDNGTVGVISGTPGATATRPTPTPNAIIAGEFIFDQNGIGSPVGSTGTFSEKRYNTLVSPNTAGKYAKIWEADLSASNNYGLEISYQEPVNPVEALGTGTGNMRLSFTCDPSKNIDGTTVKFITYVGSVDGEFRLVQLAGNKAALYHRSNHYWGRIQFRLLFQNSEVKTQDIVDQAPYEATPTGVAFWNSQRLDTGVQTVTGDGVDNTDPKNPILGFPTPAEIGAQEELGININAALEGANAPSGTNRFVTEEDLESLGPSLPPGGTAGQVLTKTGAADGAAGWQDSVIGSEPGEEKFTYTAPAAQTFLVTGSPNGRPLLYINGQYLDWTFWTWNNTTKTATVSGVTIPDGSKVVLTYFSNMIGTPGVAAANAGSRLYLFNNY